MINKIVLFNLIFIALNNSANFVRSVDPTNVPGPSDRPNVNPLEIWRNAYLILYRGGRQQDLARIEAILGDMQIVEKMPEFNNIRNTRGDPLVNEFTQIEHEFMILNLARPGASLTTTLRETYRTNSMGCHVIDARRLKAILQFFEGRPAIAEILEMNIDLYYESCLIKLGNIISDIVGLVNDSSIVHLARIAFDNSNMKRLNQIQNQLEQGLISNINGPVAELIGSFILSRENLRFVNLNLDSILRQNYREKWGRYIREPCDMLTSIGETAKDNFYAFHKEFKKTRRDMAYKSRHKSIIIELEVIRLCSVIKSLQNLEEDSFISYKAELFRTLNEMGEKQGTPTEGASPSEPIIDLGLRLVSSNVPGPTVAPVVERTSTRNPNILIGSPLGLTLRISEQPKEGESGTKGKGKGKRLAEAQSDSDSSSATSRRRPRVNK